MAGFNAAEVVEALDFDFTAFNGPRGTVPEPSSKQVKRFFNTIRDLSIEIRRASKDFDEDAIIEDAEAASIALSALDGASEEYNDKMHASIVAVCSNVFSQEDFARMPYRVQNAFTSWLVEQIRPEGATPATN